MLWRYRTTLVRVIAIDGELVTTAGRPGVCSVQDYRHRIRFWIRR